MRHFFSNFHLRWKETIKPFSTPAALTLFFFGFASGLPFLLVGWSLSTWLRDAHYDLTMIGFISYAGLIYTLKFLWSPLVDRYSIPFFCRLGQRRGWLLLAQLCVALGLAGMAWVQPENSLRLFVSLTFFAAVAGATQDIVVDAYRIEIAPVDEQAALAATYSLGYRVALIASGAGVLFMADAFSWQIAYWVLAASMIIPIGALLCAKEPEHQQIKAENATQAFQLGVVEPFREFFQRNGYKIALVFLIFIGCFKLPDQVLGVVAGPFYLDMGYSKTQIAQVSKIYGVIIGLAGAFLGGVAVVRYGLRGPLVFAALLLALSNLLFVQMTFFPGEIWSFILTLSGDNLGQGFAGTVLIAFMSAMVNQKHTATQYALMGSLVNLPGKLLGGLSGWVVDHSSYTVFFVLSCLSIIPTLYLMAWLFKRLDRKIIP